MQYREILKVLGKYLYWFSLILVIPLIIALYFEFVRPSPHPNSTIAFLETIAVTLGVASLFYYFGHKSKETLHRRDSVLLVVLIWLITVGISALPFVFSNTLTNPLDAYFESMSGYTTTGATIMAPKQYKDGTEIEKEYKLINEHFPNKFYTYYGTIEPVRNPQTGEILFEGIEAVSKAVLFWRSFIQWLGGLGIVILFLTVLPALAVGGKFLLQAEMTGPIKDSIAPRIKETASLLWKLYLGITIIEILLLIWTNKEMPLLDAFCITFSNLSTGGFAIRNESIASYNNYNTEWVIILFMFIGSINFALYFHILKGKFYKIYEPDFFLFVAVVLIGSFLVVYNLIGTESYSLSGEPAGHYTLWRAIRSGTFQAISAQTSTGFATTNFDKWPFACQVFMFLLMYFGGMSGATCGGIKSSRFYILYKIIINKIESIFRPSTVRQLKLGQREIDSNTAITVTTFFCLVTFFSILGVLGLVFDHVDSETSLGVVGCMLNNIGFAFRVAGPSYSFAFLHPFGKILSIFMMLLGRLEYFIILLLFVPSFWRIKK